MIVFGGLAGGVLAHVDAVTGQDYKLFQRRDGGGDCCEWFDCRPATPPFSEAGGEMIMDRAGNKYRFDPGKVVTRWGGFVENIDKFDPRAFGITPREPKTSYGYIRRGKSIGPPDVYAVEAFVEKPDEPTAKRYVAEGYLWNSGNFLFRADVLLEELAPHVPEDRLVVSVAAGIPTAFIEARLADGIAVVRVMSNTPVLVDQAMSAISAGAHATEEHLIRTEELLRPVGRTVRVPESQQDAVTALSGSGPACACFSRSSAPIICSRPASRAPPASARNSRWRENHSTIIVAKRPSTTCAMIEPLTHHCDAESYLWLTEDLGVMLLMSPSGSW